MYFTRNGYHDNGKLLSAKRSIVDGEPSYEFIFVPKDTVPQLGAAQYRDRQPVPSLHDVLSLVYNIAQGQRVTTPPYLDQFIDRYGKTFFRPEMHFRFTLSQDAVTNLTAISNYYHLTRNDPTIGCIERLADEYMFCCGTLGRMVWDALKRNEAEEPDDTELVIDKKKSYIFHVGMPDDARTELRTAVDSPEKAIRFAEGALASGCWKDHSTTNKDLENNRVRESIDAFKPFIESAPVFSREEFACKETAEAFIGIAGTVRHEWLIDNTGKRLYDRLGDGGERVLDDSPKKRRR